MKSYTQYLTFYLPARMAFQNITPQVAEAVRKSGVQEGLVLCNAMHITASVFQSPDIVLGVEAGIADSHGFVDVARFVGILHPVERHAEAICDLSNADKLVHLRILLLAHPASFI
jgi:thiamine phosphate synthase YjbQ (UPF0047 family)